MPLTRFSRVFFHAFILAAIVFTALPPHSARAANLTVTKTTDTNDGVCDADCSLREAVDAANNTPGADTITLPAGTYPLTLAGPEEDGNATGDLDVSDTTSNSLTIVGAGEAVTIIQQTTSDRVFHILGGDFFISAVTITGGVVSPGNGGGIFHTSGNNLTINHVIFLNNSASENFGGGALASNGGTTVISNSAFNNNTATNSNGGGAIIFINDFFGTPNATITNSAFSGNIADGAFGSGGAINSTANPLTITGSTFVNNHANATNLFSGFGGAFDMEAMGAAAVIANSTFTGNTSNNHGGALLVRDDGALTLRNVTIASNTADNDSDKTGDGGGLYVQDMGVDGTNPSVGNTILAGNTDTGGEMPDCGGDGIDHFDSAGHNLIQTTTGCILGGTTTGNVTGFDPLLAALADNGGPTQTRALLIGSPAIDAGDNALCAASPVNNVDQRGTTRPQDTACDIGAYETATPLLITTRSLLATYTAPGPSNFTITFNKPVSDLAGNSDTDDVTNPANYLVINRGVNGVTDTVSCSGGVVADDVQVPVTSVIYDSGTMTATVFFAGPLPAGSYTAFTCGTTSIVDVGLIPLAGNGVTSGTDNVFNFVVNAVVVSTAIPTAIPTATPISGSGSGSGTATDPEVVLPRTGFAPSVVSLLPAQPADKAYTALSDIWIEIPSQSVRASIYGVPKTGSGWDTTWLGDSTGWLNGTAFPSWEGNSVITGHVTNASGLPGPFANLKSLKYGDTIIIHMNGQRYVFEVRKSRTVRPQSTSYALEHLEDYSYLTLVTCQGYSEKSGMYRFRRVVRAVLVRVEADK